MNVTEYILNTLQKKYTIDKNIDLKSFNYVESGYVDSLGIIQFVVEIEDEFGINFTDDEIASPSFQIVGDLIELVESKVKNNE